MNAFKSIIAIIFFLLAFGSFYSTCDRPEYVVDLYKNPINNQIEANTNNDGLIVMGIVFAVVGLFTLSKIKLKGQQPNVDAKTPDAENNEKN